MNKTLISVIVIVLFVVNLWQWWPEADEYSNSAAQNSAQLTLLSLPLPEYSRSSTLRILTDPFYAEDAEAQDQQNTTPQQANKITVKPVVDPFKNYQLVGVLYKNRRMNAFMVVSDASHIVVKGDIINGNVLVEAVSENSVTLRHTQKNIKRTIKLK